MLSIHMLNRWWSPNDQFISTNLLTRTETEDKEMDVLIYWGYRRHCFSLQRRGDVTAVCNHLMGRRREDRARLSPRCRAEGCDTVGTSWNMGNLNSNTRGKKWPWVWASTGTGCPERPCNLILKILKTCLVKALGNALTCRQEVGLVTSRSPFANLLPLHP